MSCWKCGKKGEFAGQVCDECFREMDEQYDREISGMMEKENSEK